MQRAKRVGVGWSPSLQARVVGLLLVALGTRGALAQGGQDDTRKARGHYAEAVKHYDIGEFGSALREFKNAYRSRQDPVLLYNIGQCYWKLGDLEAAVHAYRSYLRQANQPRNAREVEGRIQELKRRIDAGESRAYVEHEPAPVRVDPAPPPIAPVRMPEPRLEPSDPGGPAVTQAVAEPAPSSRRWLWWSAAGAVVVGVVVTALVLSRSGGTADPVHGNVDPGLVNLTP